MLIKAGADVNAPSAINARYTALEAAVEGGNRVAIDILLEAGANVRALPSRLSSKLAEYCAAEGGLPRLVRAQFKGRRRFAHFFHAEFAN